MKQPTLVDTKADLRANTIGFAHGASKLAKQKSQTASAIGNGCSHAVEWVAFQEGGEWIASFCKYAGYNGLSFDIYDRLRKTNLTGTDTKRRVEKLGGTLYGVGRKAGIPDNHPAVKAVKDICSLFGKAPKLTAKVRVFTDDTRPATMDVILAAIRAANFTRKELNSLCAEARLAA